MKNEKEVNELLQRLYAEIGGDPASISTVRPLYGGWHNALRYEVSRADGATTMIEREDILESNEAGLKDGLKAFALQHGGARQSAPPSEPANAAAAAVVATCTCGYRPAASARFCSRCGRDLHAAPGSTPAGPAARGRRRAMIFAIAIACVAGTMSYWLTSRNVARDDGASRAPDSRAEKAPPHVIQRLAFEQSAPPTSAAQPHADSTTQPARNDNTNAFTASGPAARETPVPAPRQAAFGADPNRRADSRRTNARASSRAAHAARRPRSIDAVFMDHANARCSDGIGGFVCRERLRFSLCKSRWTDSEVAGMTICHVAGRGRPPS